MTKWQTSGSNGFRMIEEPNPANVLTFPNGQPIPPSPGEGMKLQKEMVDAIKDEAAAQKAAAEAADPIITNGEARELEGKRKTLFRAFELTKKQLEVDASRMEAQALSMDPAKSEDLMKIHQIMDQALALRITTNWLDVLMMPAPEPEKAG